MEWLWCMRKISYQILGNTKDASRFYMHGLEDNKPFAFIADYGSFTGKPTIVHLNQDPRVAPSGKIEDGVRAFTSEGWALVEDHDLGFITRIRMTNIILRNGMRMSTYVEPEALPEFSSRMGIALERSLQARLYDQVDREVVSAIAKVQTAAIDLPETLGVRSLPISRDEQGLRQRILFVEGYGKTWPVVCTYSANSQPTAMRLLNIREHFISMETIGEVLRESIVQLGLSPEFERLENLEQVTLKVSDRTAA
jgi:hypothetical protein